MQLYLFQSSLYIMTQWQLEPLSCFKIVDRWKYAIQIIPAYLIDLTCHFLLIFNLEKIYFKRLYLIKDWICFKLKFRKCTLKKLQKCNDLINDFFNKFRVHLRFYETFVCYRTIVAKIVMCGIYITFINPDTQMLIFQSIDLTLW